MNLPNFLTIIRILLIPFFVNLLIYKYYQYALGCFLFASITDSLDGFIARISHTQTDIGRYLDPIADKLLLSAAFITLSILNIIPVWLTIIIVTRDLILVFGTLVLHLTQDRVDISPSIMGKITTVLQLAYIILVLFLVVFNKEIILLTPLLWTTVSITIISGFHYLYRGFNLINGKNN